MKQLTTAETRKAADHLVRDIQALATRPVRLMEVCGTHTVSIFKSGLRQLLPEAVELVSGPGCPVCVTPNSFLDAAIAYSRQPGILIATFGDMLKVPGSSSTLMEERARGADIRIVYSPLDALDLARQHRERKVIFLAVGFETTSPTAAATVLQAEAEGIDNFFLLTAHKRVPPALQVLLDQADTRVDGFLLPGHVSTVLGLGPYRFLSERYRVPAVVAGFEALEILFAVYRLLWQVAHDQPALENQYKRVVQEEGNPTAQAILARVYREADVEWRGIGVIPGSGHVLHAAYERFDALRMLPVDVEPTREPAGCRCGEVLRGLMHPTGCGLFGKSCTPEHPVGACMVSVEGTCAAWHKYGAGRWQG